MVGEEFWVKMGLNVVVIGVMKGVRRWMARRGGGELSRGEGNFNALQIIDKWNNDMIKYTLCASFL